jgi:hypothetical protein
MAHHQGMCLVAAASVLSDMSMQRRFHAEPKVAATERLLQEKIPRNPVLELELARQEAEVSVIPPAELDTAKAASCRLMDGISCRVELQECNPDGASEMFKRLSA